mgnify:CR=1 FL=1
MLSIKSLRLMTTTATEATLQGLPPEQEPFLMENTKADEVMRQLCAETYAKVFHLLVSMNQYLWPIT